MSKDEVLHLIKSNKGITTSDICLALRNTDKGKVKAIIHKLVDEGKVASVRSKNYPILRQILVFDRTSEELIEEIDLVDLTADVLQTAFNNYENDPLFFEVYDLTESNCMFFTKTYNLNFNFSKNYYQLTAAFDTPQT